jgi:hypothetical protein
MTTRLRSVFFWLAVQLEPGQDTMALKSPNFRVWLLRVFTRKSGLGGSRSHAKSSPDGPVNPPD